MQRRNFFKWCVVGLVAPFLNIKATPPLPDDTDFVTYAIPGCADVFKNVKDGVIVGEPVYIPYMSQEEYDLALANQYHNYKCVDQIETRGYGAPFGILKP